MRLIKDKSDTFTGTGSLALAASYDVSGVDILSLAVRNSGPSSISAFELRAKPSMKDSGASITIENSNYTTPNANIVSCFLDPTTLTSGSSTMVDIDVSYRAVLDVYINAPIGTTVTIHAGQYIYTGN